MVIHDFRIYSQTSMFLLWRLPYKWVHYCIASATPLSPTTHPGGARHSDAAVAMVSLNPGCQNITPHGSLASYIQQWEIRLVSGAMFGGIATDVKSCKLKPRLYRNDESKMSSLYMGTYMYLISVLTDTVQRMSVIISLIFSDIWL